MKKIIPTIYLKKESYIDIQEINNTLQENTYFNKELYLEISYNNITFKIYFSNKEFYLEFYKNKNEMFLSWRINKLKDLIFQIEQICKYFNITLI